MREIVITSSGIDIAVRLATTPTADIVWRALPLFGTLRFWGRLVRIDVPLEAYREDDARDVLEPGEIAFSPDHDDILVGYGATPIAKRREIRLASPSNVFGRMVGDPEMLRELLDGREVAIRTGRETAKAGRRKAR